MSEQHSVVLVRTQTSAHALDLSAMTATRLPADVGADGWDRTDLRCDGVPIRMLSVPDVTVGQRMVLELDLRRDGIATTRTTTPVVSVETVSAN